MAQSKRTGTYSQRLSDKLPIPARYRRSLTIAGNVELKDSLKPVTHSQVKDFQEEELFARRKVLQ